MSKLQQDFLHPLFYFIHKNDLSTYGTTATQSDALPHNTTRQDWDRTEMRPPIYPHPNAHIPAVCIKSFTALPIILFPVTHPL